MGKTIASTNQKGGIPNTRTMGNLALAAGVRPTDHDNILDNPVIHFTGERIVEIPLADLYPPEFHPFNVLDDLAMTRLVKSIQRHGVREPGLARPREDGAGNPCGGYELIAGNRRKRACELAEIPMLPVIIREMDDDNAAIAMVDSNLEQRAKLLLSEKAWAYRVKLEALNHKGIKGDGLSVDVLVAQTGESKSQIFRIICLTELVPDLLDKVDAKKLAFNPAVELSCLSRKEQNVVVDTMAKYEIKPNLSQAVCLRNMKKERKDRILTEGEIEKVLSQVKKPTNGGRTSNPQYGRFFPADYTQKQMDDVIINLLKAWKVGAAS